MRQDLHTPRYTTKFEAIPIALAYLSVYLNQPQPNDIKILMIQLTALEEILLRFAGVKSITESTIRTYKRHMYDDESQFVIGNYLLVNARSFIEVFESFKKIPNPTAEINLAITANEPFAQKIQKWNGLRDLRNQVLAHGFDDKKIIP